MTFNLQSRYVPSLFSKIDEIDEPILLIILESSILNSYMPIHIMRQEHEQTNVFMTNTTTMDDEEIPHYAFKLLSTIEGVNFTLAIFLNGLVILVTLRTTVRPHLL